MGRRPSAGPEGFRLLVVLLVHSCLLVLRQGRSCFCLFAALFWLVHGLPDHCPIFEYSLTHSRSAGFTDRSFLHGLWESGLKCLAGLQGEALYLVTRLLNS